jgi:heme exporter protein D
MLDLGPHASFIVAAYSVTLVAVGALVLTTLEDDRKQRRLLAELERQGIKRRSAAKPKPPVKKLPVKTTVTKPKTTRTPAKRKPATSRARKSPS